MLAVRTPFGVGASAYEEEGEELIVSHLHGRQQLELHLAEHLQRMHFVQLVSRERMLLAC